MEGPVLLACPRRNEHMSRDMRDSARRPGRVQAADVEAVASTGKKKQRRRPDSDLCEHDE